MKDRVGVSTSLHNADGQRQTAGKRRGDVMQTDRRAGRHGDRQTGGQTTMLSIASPGFSLEL